MMTISCIVTDDEPLARKGLEGYIEKIPFLWLSGVCEDAIQLTGMVKEQQPDLLFLDIEMPYLSGIEFLKSITQPPKVIFTTAYENYALQGFELDVLDYLLKPIPFERFLKAANKAADYFKSRKQPAADYIFIKADNRLEKIFFGDILFIEALENYLAVYTEHRKYITHATLKSMEEVLPAHFVQPHKSYLVNTDQVRAVEGNLLHVKQYQVPVSKYQKDKVMESLVNNRVLKK